MRIFISYGRADVAAFARKLAAWLRMRGHEPWLDIEQGIPLGHPFDNTIEDAIRDAGIVLALISSASVQPESICRTEILYAQTHNKLILPVMISDVPPPIQIISLNFIDASSQPEDVFKLLPAALETIRITAQWQPYPVSSEVAWYSPTQTLSFQEEIVRYSVGFVGRQWLFTELQTWANDPKSRVLLLTGEAGIGKSAIAAHMTTALDVKSVHFCSRSDSESCRPVKWIQALISQIARQSRAYRKILGLIPAPNWDSPPTSLFRSLVSDCLAICYDNVTITNPWVFVIDALDEADSDMATFLIDILDRIPPWIRLVITSRPDQSILARFMRPGISHLTINAHDSRNLADVENFLQQKYHNLIASGILQETPGILEKLENLTAGNLLYASMLMNSLGDPNPAFRLPIEDIGKLSQQFGSLGDSTPAYRLQIEETDPLLPQFYAMNYRLFLRRFPDLKYYKNEVRPLLDCLIVAPAPVPDSVLITSAGVSKSEAHRGLQTLSRFLTHEDGEYRLSQKIFKKWLTCGPIKNPFAADPVEGHRRLADSCLLEVLSPDKNISTYTLLWLPTHLLNAQRVDDLAALLANPRFFVPLWNMSDEKARRIWVVVERDSSLRMEQVYAPVVRNPSQYPDEFIADISKLFYLTGHSQNALSLLEYQQKKAQLYGNDNSPETFLSNQALVLKSSDDLDGIMALYKDEEILCRERGYNNGVQQSLGNQALTLKARGDFFGALKLLIEQERICRESENLDGLQKSLENMAVLQYIHKNLDGALALFEEQEQVCRIIRNFEGLERSVGNQALIFKVLGDIERAVALYKKQEKISREFGNLFGLQRSLYNQIQILKTQRDFDGALSLLDEQKLISRELGNIDGFQDILDTQEMLKNTPPDPTKLDSGFIYISYKRQDLPRITYYLHRIVGEGHPIWYDRGIPGAAEWTALIQEKVSQCKLLLVFLSEDAVDSKWVRREITFADKKDRPILGIRLDKDVELRHGLDVTMSQYQMFDASEENFSDEFRKAIEYVRLL